MFAGEDCLEPSEVVPPAPMVPTASTTRMAQGLSLPFKAIIYLMNLTHTSGSNSLVHRGVMTKSYALLWEALIFLLD